MWISAHLHAYFALHNCKELQLEFVFYFLFTKAVTKYEGPKNVLAALFSESFFSAARCKKGFMNCAAGNFFGPTYFDPALPTQLITCT